MPRRSIRAQSLAGGQATGRSVRRQVDPFGLAALRFWYEFPFEVIDKGTGQVAVSIGRKSFVDLRQVNVTGDIELFHQSMLQVHGDNVLPDRTCSTIDGNITGSGFFDSARLMNTTVNGVIDLPFQGTGVCPF